MFSFSGMSVQMSVIFAIAATGYLLGRIRVKGVSLGTSGVFLTGLIFGHFGVSVSKDIQTLGLLFFITSVALSAGPTFFHQLKSNGRSYCILCIATALTGSLVCTLMIFAAGIDRPLAVGMMAGAFTTSPGLAAAQEAVSDPASVSSVASGYGIIYPVGVICKVIFIQLIPRILHADMAYECSKIAPPEGNASVSSYHAAPIEKWGLFSFAVTVLLGAVLGSITLPLPGGASFCLGISGGPLIVGLLIGHMGHIGPVDLRPNPALYGPAKEIGLMMFFAAAGADGGHSLARILSEYGPGLLVCGALLAVIPMMTGFFLFRKFLNLPLLSGLGSLTASMTSTPALAMLVDLAGTDDVAASYAATYPIALITLVITMQLLVNL